MTEDTGRGGPADSAYFGLAGITVRVESDLPFSNRTFDPKFDAFRADGPGSDTVTIRHHFKLPDPVPGRPGEEVYRKPPWAVFRGEGLTTYLGILEDSEELWKVMVFSDDYSVGDIYHPNDRQFRQGGLHSLTLLPTDQIYLAALLADRQACYLHSSAAVWNNQGLLFAGHSEAGKSTTVKLIRDRAEILCDDRNIIRRSDRASGDGRGAAGAEGPTGEGGAGFRVYGSWSHGEVPIVSPGSAPLRAVLFLEKSEENRLVRVTDRREILACLLACLIRPLETRDWWQKTLSLVEAVCREVPCYLMKFDKSGRIVAELEALTLSEPPGTEDQPGDRGTAPATADRQPGPG